MFAKSAGKWSTGVVVFMLGMNLAGTPANASDRVLTAMRPELDRGPADGRLGRNRPGRAGLLVRRVAAGLRDRRVGEDRLPGDG